MTKEDDILVRISGQTHRLRPEEPESLRKIPWPQRKRLIEVLEAIKKVEYLESAGTQKAKDQQDAPDASTQVLNTITVKKPVAAQTTSETTKKPNEQTVSSLDSTALMQRFLAEQKTYRSSIPTKSTIYKWFLIIFAVILLLVLVL